MMYVFEVCAMLSTIGDIWKKGRRQQFRVIYKSGIYEPTPWAYLAYFPRADFLPVQ
jgi:hypothetical protein